MQDPSFRFPRKLASDCAEFRQLYVILVYYTYGIIVVCRTVTVFPVMSAFEFRKSDLSSFTDSFKETVKGILQIAYAVLQRGGIHFTEPVRFGILLHLRKLILLIRV